MLNILVNYCYTTSDNTTSFISQSEVERNPYAIIKRNF